MTVNTRRREELAEAIRQSGHVFLPGHEVTRLLDPAGEALASAPWKEFVASWSDLRPDTHMADGGRYRLRRHAVFGAAQGEPLIQGAHQPHYQTLHHNPLNGGQERWFEPVDPGIAAGAPLSRLLSRARAVFEMAEAPPPRWHVEMHQFRIEARPNAAGKPTPEGMHRDGVDFVLVTLIGRENVAGGVTGIRVDAQDGTLPGEASFTLENPLDTVLLDDRRVWHGVTPVVPIDPSRTGHRDVLVLTFARQAPRRA
ncbi:2OG-Fe dioxygenase family protein [Roseomonas mucosa]|uniref:2OG-Fe dioxygenase family protein n=1 Tax=Roseomonas mucosa TaxID=207340 RepID=UPI00324948CF